MDDDEALVRRSQDGDLEAFGALVTRHETRVAALAQQTLGPSATTKDVEEMAMDVFTRAWRDLLLLGENREFAPWLDRLTVAVAQRRPRGSDTMPGPERVTLGLYFTGGASAGEIALLMGGSVEEVWARLSDGCRRML